MRLTVWRSWFVVLATLLAVTAVPPAARAADPADPAEQARQHNAVAKKLFSLGMFRQAATEYRKAYEAKPVPAFLFNLAQCYKRMDSAEELEQSVFYFESFIRNDPESPMVASIDDEIAQLRRRIERLRHTPVYKRWWFWTAVGVVVAGATVGTIIALQPEDAQPYDTGLGSHSVGLGGTFR